MASHVLKETQEYLVNLLGWLKNDLKHCNAVVSLEDGDELRGEYVKAIG